MRGVDCWPDHQLVHSKMHIQLARKSQTVMQKQHGSLNLSRLPTNSGDLQEKVKELLFSIDIIVMDPDDEWRAFMESIYDTAAEILEFV